MIHSTQLPLSFLPSTASRVVQSLGPQMAELFHGPRFKSILALHCLDRHRDEGEIDHDKTERASATKRYAKQGGQRWILSTIFCSHYFIEMVTRCISHRRKIEVGSTMLSNP
jgi:hypothetical protein